MPFPWFAFVAARMLSLLLIEHLRASLSWSSAHLCPFPRGLIQMCRATPLISGVCPVDPIVADFGYPKCRGAFLWYCTICGHLCTDSCFVTATEQGYSCIAIKQRKIWRERAVHYLDLKISIFETGLWVLGSSGRVFDVQTGTGLYVFVACFDS